MSLFTVLATSKVAAGVLAAGTLAVGGTGVAAVAGALPADVQQTAHELLGAPAPKLGGEAAAKAADAAGSADADAAADATAAGSASAEVSDKKVAAGANVSATATAAADAAGAASLGLCTAFTHGGLNASSEGFSSLVVKANGEANVESFCADVVSKAGAAAHAKAAGEGSATAEAKRPELPAAPAVPAVPAVPGVDDVRPVPAVPSVPAVPGNVVDAPSVSAR